jgi:hypothetical protein
MAFMKVLGVLIVATRLLFFFTPNVPKIERKKKYYREK